jgi:hypothetical protein
MTKTAKFPLPARVAAALERLRTQTRDLMRVYGYRPEKHYMRGPGPRSGANGSGAKADSKPQLPAR